MRSIVHLLFLGLTLSLSAQSTYLYPVFEKGHWGFIYEDGSMAIRPQFHSVGTFDQGLAPARPGGLYGYIDESGDFFLEPRFEYAEPFRDGVAIVYLEAGHPVLIDRTGKVLFEHNYKSIERREESNRLLAITATGQKGLLDYEGRVVIDTFYEQISELVNEHYIVYPTAESFAEAGGTGEFRRDMAVMDQNGQEIIPLGLYHDISPFGLNHWLVYPYMDESSAIRPRQRVLDQQMEPAFPWQENWTEPFTITGFTDQGLAPIDVYLVNRDTMRNWSSSQRPRYATIINDQGKQLFSDKGYNKIIPFADKRFFALDTNNQWRIIDPLGKVIHEEHFTELHYSLDGETPWIIAESVQGGNWAFHPGQEAFELPAMPSDSYGYWRLSYDHVYFSKEDYDPDTDTYQWKTSVLDLEGARLWSPPMRQIQEGSVDQELMAVVLANGNPAYLNEAYSVVYESKPTSTPSALNVDYQMRAYCYASQRSGDPTSGLGGNARSENVYQALPSVRQHLQAAKLEVIKEPDLTFNDQARGIRLRLANYLPDTLVFPAQDSRIELVIQAQDQTGAWRDIEYLPSSWCGNSYHDVILPPNNYWNFIIPQYSGAMKTKFRARVKCYQGEQELMIYSDPYQASVNPGQFWRRLDYTPRGLMDPYDN